MHWPLFAYAKSKSKGEVTCMALFSREYLVTEFLNHFLRSVCHFDGETKIHPRISVLFGMDTFCLLYQVLATSLRPVMSKLAATSAPVLQDDSPLYYGHFTSSASHSLLQLADSPTQLVEAYSVPEFDSL